MTKLDHGGRLVWSTFLGGDLRDRGSSIGVGPGGDVFLSGSTRGDFPVTPGAAQGVFGGARDWFVARLDRSGSAVDWSTYLGGSDLDGDIDTGLAVDAHRHVDVIGMTASTDFPTTPDAIQHANAGVVDIAIAQLDRNGRLLFASYLGGSGIDDTTGGAPALDRQGHVYFGGITTSTDFPVTSAAVQPAYGGGDIDAFLVKLDLGRDPDDALSRGGRWCANSPGRVGSGRGRAPPVCWSDSLARVGECWPGCSDHEKPRTERLTVRGPVDRGEVRRNEHHVVDRRSVSAA